MLSTANLIDLCHALRHSLDAGLTLVQVFRQQARKGPAAVRPLAERILQVLESGQDLETALRGEPQALPPLFLALAGVGERTGALPEVFAALESYYRSQQRLWQQVRAQSTLPILQLVGAILVITALIFVLGLIAESQNTEPLDPLGLGLTGTRGAVIFLGTVVGVVGLFAAGYRFAQRSLRHQQAVDALLLRLPVLGPCLQALALSRFCLALRLTLETALPIDAALALCLRATGNAALAAQARTVQSGLRSGKGLAEVVNKIALFPEDFRNYLAIGEEGGRLPEMMRHQAKQYEEQAEQRLAVLARLLGFGVWLFVAILIIVAIFRIFTTLYLGPMTQF